MLQNVFLILALVLSTITGVPTQGGEAVEAPSETLPIPPYYELLIAQDPADPRVFHVWAPNEVITPVRAEAAMGAEDLEISGHHFKIKGVEGFVGPFEWHPAFPDGWGVSITFDETPTVVVAAVVAWDGMTREVRVGYGFWVDRRVSAEIFLPLIENF